MSALAGLQAGFGLPLGEVLYDVRTLGFTVVRLDCQDVDDATTTALAEEALVAGVQPLVIIRRPEQMHAVPYGCRIELGNEPDLEQFGWTIASYTAAAEECVAIAMIGTHLLYLGAVSNLNERGFDFLAALPWETYPSAINCSIHRYPETGSATKPHDRFRSRAAEVDELRRLVGHRRLLACSEVGYNDVEWTAAEVACNMVYERQFWSDQGFEFVVGYQLNDGPSPDAEEHYGFRRLDGTWKPVAYTFPSAPR